MIVIKRVLFYEIEQDWKRLTSNNMHCSPFRELDYAKEMYNSYKSIKLWRNRPVFYAFYDGDEVIMIAPLERHLTKRGFIYYAYGSFFKLVFQDFIYSDNTSKSTIEECLLLLSDKLGGDNIILNFQSEDSKLYEVLKDKYTCISSEVMCKVDLPCSFDEYYKMLSSNMRNTIQNAENRINTDGKTFDFYLKKGHALDSYEYKQFLSIYTKSYFERYNIYRRGLDRYFHTKFLKYKHPHSLTMNKIDSSIIAICKIDGEMAAILGGFMQKNGDYFILNRMAFNPKFSRYSPGILLLIDTIKNLIENKLTNVLDFSRGNETYKYKFLSKDFYQHGFKLVEKSQNEV